MMRFLGFMAALLLGLAAARTAPLDDKDSFWSEWSTWWHPWCHVMNRDTWADPDVRAVLKDKVVPVHVDQDSRPDISQRYERWG